ncbi:MAG: hypothetical protein IJ991_15365, partial [Thermoguttaceae bacterium]|nr:hypothetical protein [Thermoguttaceae bacterium]
LRFAPVLTAFFRRANVDFTDRAGFDGVFPSKERGVSSFAWNAVGCVRDVDFAVRADFDGGFASGERRLCRSRRF